MKFGKHLCSMLFQICPEAVKIVYHGSSSYVGSYAYIYKRDNEIYSDKIHCEPPDQGEPREYTRDDIFVYGEEVEVYKEDTGWKAKGIFDCYLDNGSCRVDMQSWIDDLLESEVRKIQKEEMVTVYISNNEDVKHISGNKFLQDIVVAKKQIPKSEAERLGLL